MNEGLLLCEATEGSATIGIHYGEPYDGSADAVVGETWAVNGDDEVIERLAAALGAEV